MYVFSKTKINKFREVRIPSKGEFFNTGRFVAQPTQYGGEENTIDMNADRDKAETAEALAQYDKLMQDEANK